MAQKSHGSRHGTRKKFAKDGDTTLTVNDRMKEFEEGDKVVIQYHPSVQKGRAHSRYHGRPAEVTGQRGGAYQVKIEDGDSSKKLFLKPIHLREVQN